MRTLLVVTCLAASPLVLADDEPADDVIEHSIGAERFAAGGSVELKSEVAGDAFLAGGDVSVHAPIAGDAFVAGGHVDVYDAIGKGLYVAGGSVLLAGSVGRGARVAGASIEVAPGAMLKGTVWLAGRTLTMAGNVAGHLHLAGQDVELNGTVDGDAEIAAEHIAIGPQARVSGHLRYRSPRAPTIAPGASLAGGVESLAGRRGHWYSQGTAPHPFRYLGSGLSFGSALALGALLLLIAPAFMAGASRIVRSEWPAALGIGVAVLVGVPIGIVVLFLTLIGIPAGLLAIALYAAVLLLGYVIGAVAVADLGLAKLAPNRVDGVGWRILALLFALLALGLVRHVPLLGALTALLVFLSGVGALALRTFGHGRAAAPPSA